MSGVQAAEPGAEYDLPGHGTHTAALVAPTAAEKVPAGQLAHVAADVAFTAADHVPAPHDAADRPAPHHAPRGQPSHAPELASSFPAPHAPDRERNTKATPAGFADPPLF